MLRSVLKPDLFAVFDIDVCANNYIKINHLMAGILRISIEFHRFIIKRKAACQELSRGLAVHWFFFLATKGQSGTLMPLNIAYILKRILLITLL